MEKCDCVYTVAILPLFLLSISQNFELHSEKKTNCNFDPFSEEDEGEIDSDEEEEEMETAGKTFVVNVHKPNLIKQVQYLMCIKSLTKFQL